MAIAFLGNCLKSAGTKDRFVFCRGGGGGGGAGCRYLWSVQKSCWLQETSITPKKHIGVSLFSVLVFCGFTENHNFRGEGEHMRRTEAPVCRKPDALREVCLKKKEHTPNGGSIPGLGPHRGSPFETPSNKNTLGFNPPLKQRGSYNPYYVPTKLHHPNWVNHSFTGG